MPAATGFLFHSRQWLGRLPALGAVALAYGAMAWVSFLLTAWHPVVSALWLPSGFALFIVLQFGYWTWPGIAAGAFLANLLAGLPLPAPVMIGLGNASEALLAAVLLHRIGFSPDLSRLRDISALFALGALVAPLPSATIGVGALLLTGSAAPESAWLLWRVWWSGDAIGVVLLTPLLLLWMPARARFAWPRVTRDRLVDGVLFLVALGILTWALFGGGLGERHLVYTIFPLAMLMAWRLGPRGTVIGIAFVAVISGELTIAGKGPYPPAEVGFLPYQVFLALFATSILSFAVALAQRERAEAAVLRKARELAAAQELAGMGNWSWQPASNRVFWSDHLYRVFGLTPGEEFAGTLEDFLGRFHPDDRESVEETFHDAVRSGDGFRRQERIIRPDGEIRVLSSVGEVIRDQSGTAVEMMGVCHDVTEQWTASTALRESEALLRAVFERSTVGMALMDASGRLVHANQAFLRMLGRQSETVPELTLEQSTDPRDQAAVSSALQRLVEGRAAVVELELQHPRAPGDTVWARHSLSTLPAGNGTPLQVVSVVLDITQRKRAELRLEWALADVRQLVESARAILWRGDPPSLSFTFVSREAEAVLGYPVERWVQDSGFWREQVHPEDRDAAGASYYLAVLEGGAHEFEYRMIAADGRVVLLRERVRVVYRNGVPAEVVGVMADVTEQRQAENMIRALHRTTQILNSTLELDRILDALVEQGAALVDAEGGLAGLRTAHGMAAERIRRRGAWMTLGRTWPPGQGFPGWVLESGASAITNEAGRDSRIDPAVRDLVGLRSALTTPILDARGEVIAFLEIHNKIAGGFTERDRELLDSIAQAAALAIQNAIAFREQAENRARLQALSHRLITAHEDERRRVAREIHDELGQTLVGVRMGLENLRQDLAARALSEARRRVRMLLELVQDTMKQIQQIVLRLRPAILDNLGLAAALEWAGEDFQRRTGIFCTLELPEPLDPLDPERAVAIFRVAQEALTNVARHARASRVTVSLERLHGMLVLQVSDDGRGLDLADLAKPTSIGLTGMRERAAALGGTLELNRNNGMGTTVILRVPLEPVLATEPV